jgi:hypothetical protein
MLIFFRHSVEHRRAPVTSTGRIANPVPPTPSCPWALLPQHLARPPLDMTHVWASPRAMPTAETPGGPGVGGITIYWQNSCTHACTMHATSQPPPHAPPPPPTPTHKHTTMTRRMSTFACNMGEAGDVSPSMQVLGPVGGPLAALWAEAASLLYLLMNVTNSYSHRVDLLVSIDCLMLLDILL